MRAIHTVTGPVQADGLGTTLMHEHLAVGYPGWQLAGADRAVRREHAARCIERMQELEGHGLRTLVDPCPIDLGRDVELMAEVAAASRVHIICATGLYKEEEGAAAYFKFRSHWGDALGEMTELFVRELSEGIDGTGIRAGVIKVATGPGRITPYEETVLRAAAHAHRATGAPITTHTDQGTMGVEQLDILASEGVDPRAVVVTIVAALALAGVWEIFEFSMDTLQSSREQDDLTDTMLDMIDGGMGGAAAAAWVAYRPRPPSSQALGRLAENDTREPATSSTSFHRIP